MIQNLYIWKISIKNIEATLLKLLNQKTIFPIIQVIVFINK